MVVMPSPPPLVIGVGNRDRGDDAIGPLVADMFAGRDDVETLVAEGDLSDLALRWARHHQVVIVDAIVSGRKPGTVVQIDALDERLPIDGGLVSSHGVGVTEAIELARVLGRLPQRLTIIGVESTAFAQFDELTPDVADAIRSIADRVEHLLGIAPCTTATRKEVQRARTCAV